MQGGQTHSQRAQVTRIIGFPICVSAEEREAVASIPDPGERSRAAASLNERNLELVKKWMVAERGGLGLSQEPRKLRKVFHVSRALFRFPNELTKQARLLGVSVRARDLRKERVPSGSKRQLRREARELGIEAELVRALNNNDPVIHMLVDPMRGQTIPHLGPPPGEETNLWWTVMCSESELFNILNMQPYWCEYGQHWYVAGRHRQQHCSVHSGAGRQATLRHRRRLKG